MYRYCNEIENMFSSSVSWHESIAEVSAEIETVVSSLPEADKIIALMDEIPQIDKSKLEFNSIEDYCFTIDSTWADGYSNYISGLDKDDKVTIRLNIAKSALKGIINIYSIEHFCDWLLSKKEFELLNLFDQLFRSCPSIRFNCLDTEDELFTKTISFCRPNTTWPVDEYDREKQLKICWDASLFLNHNEIALLPEDFLVVNGAGRIKETFGKLSLALALMYTANSSHFVGNNSVLQFAPSQKGFECDIQELIFNKNIYEIYRWVFNGESAVDRAGIARNIISINCKTKAEVLSIDADILASIKSNYSIYQAKTVNDYIEIKEKIADFITESTTKIQEMIHDLVEGVRNNFIAVVMFLISIILTDSVDWEAFLTGTVSADLIPIVKIFLVASVVYFVATYVAMFVKLNFLKKSYSQLKENYNDLLDSTDIDNIFKKDKPVKEARKNVWIAATIIAVVWIAFLVFVGVMFNNVVSAV